MRELHNSDSMNFNPGNETFKINHFDEMDWLENEHFKFHCLSNPHQNEEFGILKHNSSRFDTSKINRTANITDYSMNNDISNDLKKSNNQFNNNQKNLILGNNDPGKSIEMHELINSDDTKFNPGNDVFTNDDQLDKAGHFFNKTAPSNMTSLKGIKLTEIKGNRMLNCQIEVPKNPTVAYVSDVHIQSNLIFDKNGWSKFNCYEYSNNNTNQEGRYPLVCK